ncbi:metal-dependent hydrolase [Candidatus Micrarchaeota archaeon]|nr:metal-dependent hydrolase [Candidatus Micrarchaeota archaeon]
MITVVEITFFGHSFFKIDFNGTKLLFDPFMNNTCQDSAFNRILPCTAKKCDLEKIDLILISHEHFDHFDKKAIESIVKQNNSLVVAHDSILNKLSLERRFLHPLNLDQKINLRDVTIECVTAHHPESFYPVGFIVSSKGKSVYFSGDTSLIDSFSEINVDVALLPIGGTYTMDCVDCVKATKLIKPKYVIPMHYNTFEMIKCDVNELKRKIEKSVLTTKPILLNPGETFKF